MKIKGSNIEDTLFGTTGNDTINARGGDDLISTRGGIDTIDAGSGNDMITGFSYKLSGNGGGGNGGGGGDPGIGRASARMHVDGGSGDDVMIIEMSATKGQVSLGAFKGAFAISNVEEFIYNFASVSNGQKIVGLNSNQATETIVVGSGNAVINARGGDDFIYSGDGADVINGGKGSDFISAGAGHNTVAGGGGTDYFHFHLTGTPQYTAITDFEAGVDKILVSIDATQFNLLFGTDVEGAPPVRWYGDEYLGVGNALNDYVSYNNGRAFDPVGFDQSFMSFSDWGLYEEATGSIFVLHYTEENSVIDTQRVLVAQVKPGTLIDDSDFSFRLI